MNLKRHKANVNFTPNPFILVASLMKRMKELEDENRRLKKMYAEEYLISEVRNEALEGKW